MDISVIYSVYDRRDYVLRALSFLERQTLNRDRWEVVIVDDDSPGNYLEDLEPWYGKINLQYLRIDAFQHPVIQALNPGGKPLLLPESEPLRFHTPALSHNIAFRAARGKVLFITQPDVLQKETNLATAVKLCRQKRYFFGRLWLSGPQFRKWALSQAIKEYPNYKFEELLKVPQATRRSFRKNETYWYVSAVQKEAVDFIRGVDEDYLGGVFAEDDHFRARVALAGWATEFTEKMAGIHIDHSQLNGRHDRSGHRWKWGANRNRSMWQTWSKDPNRKPQVNLDREWGSMDFVTRHEVWDR